MTRSQNFTWDGKPVEYLQLPRSPVRKGARADRPLARARTLGCTGCELRDGCRAPVPPTFPATPTSPFAVIGEAPGELEDRRGQVFVGKSGQVLRRFLREAGLDDTAAAWMNVNACRPSGNATPTVDQRAACRENLLRGLSAANTRYVLLCGSVAVNAWRVGMKVTKVRGHWFIWWQEDGGGDGGERRGWWVFPTLHPAAVLRQPGLRAELREDVKKFAAVVWNPKSVPVASLVCVECGGEQTRWDADGVGWCEKDWAAQVKAADRGVRRGGKRVHRDQESFKF